MRVAILTPTARGTPNYHYTASLAVTYHQGLGKTVDALEYEALPHSSLISLARNQLAAAALFKGADKLVFIDDDISWQPADLRAMLEHDEPIVHGAYLLRNRGTGPAILSYGRDPDEPVLGTDELFMSVRQIGGGMTVIDKDVFREMMFVADQYEDDSLTQKFGPGIKDFIFNYFPQGVGEVDGRRMYLGEDKMFSMVAQELGIPMVVYCNGVIGHHHGDRDLYCNIMQLRSQVAKGQLQAMHPAI